MSTLARGFEWGMYSHDACTYVHMCGSCFGNVDGRPRNVAVYLIGTGRARRQAGEQRRVYTVD